VRNCRIVHDATFDYHSRPQDDPLLSQESLVRAGRMGYFAAVALRGDHIEITDCDVKGAGIAVILFGTRDGLIARNTLRLGSFGNSYSLQQCPERPWERIIIEDNVFAVATNVNHSASWMNGAGTYAYIARNHMQPIFWVCDCEGLLFHQSEMKLTCEATGVEETSVTLSKGGLAALYGRCKCAGELIEEDGTLKPGALKGFTAVIAHGRGLAQWRRITGNTADAFTIDRPWAVRPAPGCTIALLMTAPFIKMRLIDNIVEDGGSGIYFWGSGFEAIVDGNRLYRNHGVNFEDLSSACRTSGWLDYWEFSACYCNQMLHNIVSEGRADAVAGLYGGCRYPDLPAVTGAAGFVARGNLVDKDTRLIAQPGKAMPGALNYLGVVFEHNVCRDGAVGIQLGEGVEAVLRENTFSDVDCPVKDGGAHVTRVND
jgi:hypothetical protein